MPSLHNRVNRAEMRQRLYAETEPRTTLSFYKYFPVADSKTFRDSLFAELSALKVFGRVYVAAEGINAQVSVPKSRFEELREALYAHPEMDGMRLNIAVDDDGKSFWYLKVKVRSQIVTDGITDPTFNLLDTGTHLKAAEANALAQQPDTVIVDMRNHYEYEVGHFDGALEVPSETFKEQLPMAVQMLEGQKDKAILMYCTGGIRCEKASAYLRHQGFENVYQLEGGIIEYARRAKEEGLPLLFKGKNFVFDGRMGERITDDVLAHCHQCGALCDTHVNCANDDCHLLFIQCPKCAAIHEGCCSGGCHETLHLPASERRQVVKSKENFTKRRWRGRPAE